MIPKERGINERHPPSTREWNEFEAKQDQRRYSPPKGGSTRRKREPLPMLTDEQVAASAKWIYTDLVLLIDAFDAAPWDDRWTNRLMSALLSARNTLETAAKKGPEDGVARLVGTDETETAQAAGANPADGSGRQAGEAEIHRS